VLGESPTVRWDPPSERVAELIRAAAARLIEDPADAAQEIDAAVLAGAPPGLRTDPALIAEVSASNRGNLYHWIAANLREPGAHVAPNLSPESLAIARDLVRRGLDEAALNSYRTGQNAAWRRWMATAFELTSDPGELRELLEVSARSIFTFVDETLSAIAEQIERERDQLTRGTHAERLEVVNLILEGAPITARRASARLGYELGRWHTAAVLWRDGGPPDQGELEGAADALARAAGARRPFTVVASASALWAWFATHEAPDLGAVRAVAPAAGVRAALGSPAAGIDGFRRSHLDALATQRLMHRMPSDLRLAAYDEVRLVALTTQDEERAAEFVARTLGELAVAPPEVRETLRVYVREGMSASRAARALFTHRNTVLNRVARAQELLPLPLPPHLLEVGLALEIVRWLGPRPGATAAP
jgi:DNA-binding PucR family transcriptional regulator